jgi:hypothetical protein
MASVGLRLTLNFTSSTGVTACDRQVSMTIAVAQTLVTDQVGLLVVIARRYLGRAFDACAVNCYPIDLACGGSEGGRYRGNPAAVLP